MHGLGSRPIAPASNAAGRGNTGGTPLTARRSVSCHVDSPTHTHVAQIGPTRAVSAKTAETANSSRNGRVRPKFKKIKKKSAKRTV